jgi:hypothetical protein
VGGRACVRRYFCQDDDEDCECMCTSQSDWVSLSTSRGLCMYLHSFVWVGFRISNERTQKTFQHDQTFDQQKKKAETKGRIGRKSREKRDKYAHLLNFVRTDTKRDPQCRISLVPKRTWKSPRPLVPAFDEQHFEHACPLALHVHRRLVTLPPDA